MREVVLGNAGGVKGVRGEKGEDGIERYEGLKGAGRIMRFCLWWFVVVDMAVGDAGFSEMVWLLKRECVSSCGVGEVYALLSF